MLSDEVDDFRREIQISSDATFFDLHNAIIASVNYKAGEMASFFICSDNWEKEKEITLTEMDTSYEEDSFIMEDSILNDFLEDEKQKLMYTFDYLTERSFFLELAEMITGKDIEQPICTRSQGNPPTQFVEFDDFDIKTTTIETGETFYGDEGYDIDELDLDGFEGFDSEAPSADGEKF